MTYTSFNKTERLEVRIGNHVEWKYILGPFRINDPCDATLPPKPNHLPLIGFLCNPSLGGRYMSVQSMTTSPLELAEVEVDTSGQ